MRTVVQYTSTGAVQLTGRFVTTSLMAQGPQGPAGARGAAGAPGSASSATTREALTALSGHRAVRALGDHVVDVCDPSDPSAALAFLGVTTGAAGTGEDAIVQTSGELVEPSWSWTPGLPVFVGAGGVLTQSSPLTGFALVVGFAQSATSLWIHPQPAVFL